MWWGGNMMGWGGWGLYGLLHILWWVLVVVAIVALVRWLFGGNRLGREEDRALSILRERYAKGEISKEEFEARKRDLAA